MLEQVKRTIWKKKWKRKISKKKQKNSVFGWLWRKCFFFVKMSFFRKICKHYLCSDGKKQTRIFVATICFGKVVFFFWPFQVTKHYKNRGFSRHRGKPQIALLVAKVPFWEGAPKGLLLSVIPKSCVLLKNTIFIVFSAKHSFADMREQKKMTKIGVVCQNGQRCFFGPFWGFGGFVFWVSLCFCASVLYAIARNGYFPAFLEVFCLFCSHKRPALNCLCSSYFAFFAFVLPFKNPFSSLLSCPSTPL